MDIPKIMEKLEYKKAIVYQCTREDNIDLAEKHLRKLAFSLTVDALEDVSEDEKLEFLFELLDLIKLSGWTLETY